MRVSAKAEYACIAMLELAATYAEPQPVRLKDIADAHGIPQRFLVQILLQLKTAGLVASVRGAAGGYQLARTPDSISLADIINAIDDRALTPRAARNPDRPAEHARTALTRRVDAPHTAGEWAVLPDLTHTRSPLLGSSDFL